MPLKRRPLGCLFSAAFFLSGAGAAIASPYAWFGGTGNWDKAVNWTPSGIPGSGDDVNIDSGIVNLTGPTAIDNITMTGGGAPQLAGNGWDLTVHRDIFLEAGVTLTNVELKMDATLGTATLDAATPIPGLTIAGTANVVSLAGDLHVAGDLIIASGSLDVGPLGFTVSVTGDWSSTGGDFLCGTGTVVLDGVAASSISGNNTFYDFTCEIPGKELLFEAFSSQVIQGSLILRGSAANMIKLRSNASPDQWIISNEGGTETVEYVRVQDSAVAGTYDINAYYSFDDGNNATASPGWKFIDPAVSAGLGPSSPRARTVGSRDSDVPILQIALEASGEDITVSSITVEASGSGNDADDVEAVHLYHDADGDGSHSAGDAYLASAVYKKDNGRIVFDNGGTGLGVSIAQGTVAHLLLVYDLDVTTLGALVTAGPQPRVPFSQSGVGAMPAAAVVLPVVVLLGFLVSKRRWFRGAARCRPGATRLCAVLTVLLIAAAFTGCVLKPLQPAKFTVGVTAVHAAGTPSMLEAEVAGVPVKSEELSVEVAPPQGIF